MLPFYSCVNFVSLFIKGAAGCPRILPSDGGGGGWPVPGGSPLVQRLRQAKGGLPSQAARRHATGRPTLAGWTMSCHP